MSSPYRDPRITLPDHWPRCVRSAVVHAVSMANVAFTVTQARTENHFSSRTRLQATNDRLQRQIALLLEELRINDARMERLPAQRRPHYPAIERLAILELRAARGWSQAETARRLLVTPLTVASWTQRLDDEGPDALVQVREPVNRFPQLVSYLVRRLRALCPRMGSRRIARVFARAGLHFGATTVRRMLKPAPKPKPASRRPSKPRIVTAKHPNHVVHLDLTTVPTIGGFWISWLPLSLPQRWPFCWWVAVVVDHFSRRAMGVAHFKKEPTAREVTNFLGRACRRVKCWPTHLITDHGPQFTADAFIAWCRRRSLQQRFGAIGKYGSLAVIERYIRSLKTECTRLLPIVPFARAACALATTIAMREAACARSRTIRRGRRADRRAPRRSSAPPRRVAAARRVRPPRFSRSTTRSVGDVCSRRRGRHDSTSTTRTATSWTGRSSASSR